MTQPAFRISLIGGFSISGDGSPPVVRGLIPQAVIARLAVAGGEPMRAESLVNELWADPPGEVLSSLRAHISRLRSRGWEQMLVGGRDGYRLDTSRLSVDAVEFGALVDDAEADRADGERLHELDDALRRWVPHPLAWAREFPFSAPLEERLDRLRRRAALRLATARIDAGDPGGAVAILEPVADEHPADGAIHLALARALARAGRPGDALRALDHHVAASDQTGVDPHPDASALRSAIVRQDPDVLGLTTSEASVERIGIPLPLTRFVGRTDLLRVVEEGRASSRLVTLTGAAGVGKTRLAIESARRSNPADDEIQWLVDLTSATADDVLPRIAETVGASEQTSAAIERALTGRRTLLVLDNAEHVLGAVAAACAALLGLCAGLSILVTSRESLRMPGERVILVPPLVGDQLSDAVQLFLERATDASGVQGWDAEQMRIIERLCGQLDGLPLAIELAASRLDVLGIDELASSLESYSDGPARRGVDRSRHEDIDAAIEWSVRLTSTEERDLLAQLAGFAGPFTLEMVAGICTVDGQDERQLAVSLARKSLVHGLSGVGERRFRLLESVKQYARRRHPLPDPDSWSRRHAEWLSAASLRAARQLTTVDAPATRTQLRERRADYDQALLWALAAGDRLIAVTLLGSLGRFWAERSAGAEVIALIERALALPGASEPNREAEALRAACFISAVVSTPASVAEYNRRHLETASRADDPVHPMLASSMCAFFAIAAGDEEEMDRLLGEAERHRVRVGDDSQWAVADHLSIKGEVLRVARRPSASLDALSEAFRLAGDVGQGWARANSCLVSGKTLIDVGRARDALPIVRTGMLKFLENDDPSAALAAASVYAVALAALDRMHAAAEIIGAVEALGSRFGYRGNAVDPDYAERGRERVRAALARDEWEGALERGSTRSIRWLAENVRPE